MFQFLVDWKRKHHTLHRNASANHSIYPQSKMIRNPSISSTTSSPSNCSIDWHSDKRTWSFKEDYVSFPSLEPESVPCSS
ncbi:hypothetical protein BDF14DRAFT_1853966 [Spinellus fusiger]|nr:hypothetical protein BDF14DRAFT_1853966 [Spinellus fusiger]